MYKGRSIPTYNNIRKEKCLLMIYVIFHSFITTSWITSIVIMFVILFRKVFGTYMGTKLRQILWGIILLRLLFPVLPESSMSLMNWIPTPQQIIQSVAEGIADNSIGQSNHNEETEQIQSEEAEFQIEQNQPVFLMNRSFNDKNVAGGKEAISSFVSLSLEEMLFFIWATGVVLFLGIGITSIMIFQRTNYKTEQDVSPQILEEFLNCKRILKIKKNILLRQLPKIKSPIITGVFKPKIYLPQELIEHIGPEQRISILLHELLHWKRKDTIWNFVLFLVISLHWFNPLVWLASQKMKEDWEMSCDVAVLEVLGEDEVISYGNTILQVAQFQNGRLKGFLYQTAFYGNKKQIKRRILMINKFHIGMANKITSIALIACIGLGIVTLTDATSYADRAKLNENNVKTTTNRFDPYATPSKFQLYDPSYQYFDELEQFCRYADFSFQIPNNLPKIFEVNDYRIHRDEKNKSVIEVNYWYNTMNGAMVEEAEEEHFQLKISENNLLETMIPNLTEEEKKESRFTYHHEIKHKVFAGISGTQLTITRKDKEGYPSGGNNESIEEQTEHFIWKKDGVWYAMEYLTEVKLKEKSYYSLYLSDKEVESVIASFTDPKEITHPGYSLQKEMPSFAVYDENDLKRVSRDWGFSPKLPMELPGLKAKSANMSDVLFNDDEYGIFSVRYVSSKNPSSKYIAEYEQATLPAEYNSLEKLYQEQQKRELKSAETACILQIIKGEKVYALEEKNKTTQRMHYYWKNGSLSINGQLGDHIEVLKILIRNTK